MKRALRSFLIAVGILAGGLVVVTAGVVAALPVIADHVPLQLSRLVVSDGKRQVEMQGMVHVAKPDFYREIAAHIAQRRREGWLVFYEEVRPDEGSSPAGVADVLRRLGANWNPDSKQHPYEMMAGIIGNGLVLQDNRALLGPPGPDVRNVDVTLSQLLAALPPEEPAGGKGDADGTGDGGEEDAVDLAQVRQQFAALPGWAQRRVQAGVRIMLATTASGTMVRDMLPPALTTLREDKVVKAIRDEPGRNILILYGQVHIDHIRSMLAQADPNWRTISSTSLGAF
ncbi:hypothetical protein [Azospirillum rugosum]|uniref:Uncharacterized protein n=1 Tax=Azospirillum rugosum TaxID=416170 RepID=A0ABS4SG49_9PROT|nr:hypothetical protein [Azospirillum rugosum]MBP2291527.1 hypothetical protein [Azospirillum rugosum]MDQ0525315.1 hypothetical protein [Azospirillum rugosum]